MKKIIAIISVFALMLAFAGCGAKDKTDSNAPSATNAAANNQATTENHKVTITDLPGDYSSMGNKDECSFAFYFETVNKNGDSTKYEIYTSETKLGAALSNFGIITLNDDNTVKSVWGEEYNYEKTGYAWLVYKNGEALEGGLDVAIDNGANYLFRVETF